MDCFVACAPLRKRFAFVAGNDAASIRHHAGTFGSGVTFGSGLFTR